MKAGWDAAPAGGARNPVPGRPWAAVRPYYEGPPSLAGRGADEGGRKPAGSGAQEGPVRARKLRSRGQKSRQWRAERRRAPATVRAHKDGCAGRRATPSALCRGPKGDDGVPGAAKNTGDDAWLFDN